jgi:glycosyltransferase involved in cell wall biosynthesis
MKILIVLTYYTPHISGLTIYVERLARSLAQSGHQITVLTSRFDRNLPCRESMEGVSIVRHPVAFRLSKGVIMPGFLLRALSLMARHDVASIHLPQAEGGALAFLARVVARKPVVLTYHCDLKLPKGLFNRVVERMVFASNMLAALFADGIVSYTRDYADNSPLLSRFAAKIRVILPPIVMPSPEPAAVAKLRERYHAENSPIVGFAARFAEEKGIDCLIDSIPLVAVRFPEIKYLLAGETSRVIGEKVWERLQPKIEANRRHLEIVGTIPNGEMGNFFGVCDLLVVPSINSTESFGLVQVEAMLSGTPVVASDLPGVREPVRMTGMGEVVPINSPSALAEAIIKLLSDRVRYLRPRSEIADMFNLADTISAYERLFRECTKSP